MRQWNFYHSPFRNDSGNITVEIEITFGQDVSMSAFIRLHEAMYSNGTLGNITIYPISDNSKRLIWLLLYRLVPKFYEKEVYEILMLQTDSITREGRMAFSLTLVNLLALNIIWNNHLLISFLSSSWEATLRLVSWRYQSNNCFGSLG